MFLECETEIQKKKILGFRILTGVEFVMRRYVTLEPLVGYLESYLPTFHAIPIAYSEQFEFDKPNFQHPSEV